MYTIVPIRTDDTQKVTDFLGRHFDVDSPLSTHLNITEPSADSVAVDRHYIAQGCSYMAVNEAGDVLGVFLTKIIYARDAGTTVAHRISDPKMRLIVEFVEYLEAKCPLFERYADCDRALEAAIVSVGTEHRGQGIAQALMEQTLRYACEAGIPLVTCVCSSLYSARLCARAGFEEMLRYTMADWEVNGERPLQVAAPHTDAVVFAKRV